MNFKNCIIVVCLSTFSFISAAEEVLQSNSEISVNPVPADQLPPPAPLDPNGGISAYAAAGAWTDVVYNPNITVAGQWYYGPLMEAPAGTPTTSIVQNITWQWNIFNYDSNLTTYLCESTLSTCFDVSGNFGAGGNVDSFNIPANRSWRYLFIYAGSGSISPALLGQNGSIAVTYQ